MSTDDRIGCVDPFTDDNASLHRKAITELHARGLLFGCGYRLACPSGPSPGARRRRSSTVLGLPDTSHDSFTDDGSSPFPRVPSTGSPGQGGPRLGWAQLLSRAEPDQAEFAAMAVRALDLPRDRAQCLHRRRGPLGGVGHRRLRRGRRSPRAAARSLLPQPPADQGRVGGVLRQGGQPESADRTGFGSLATRLPPPGDPPPIPPEEQD